MDRDEAMRLLRGGEQGVTEWNRLRKAGEVIPGLRDADLRGADLTRANLGGADLSMARLDRARLSEAYLRGAKLKGAALSGAILMRADFMRAHLKGANLMEANLMRADLAGADLRAAHLRGANLEVADLDGASLGGADLTEVDLTRADLAGADLRGANLTRANLIQAHLRGTNLMGVNLTEASCDDTIFADVDLSEVEGLDSIRHRGPSPISTSTLIRSRGKLPEAFLRGCGLPDAWIVNLPALIGSIEPIQFHSCFISYSTKDEDFATRLHSRMRDEGLRVWYSPEDIRGVRKLHEQIDQAIRVHDKLLLVLSPHSMRSEWVRTEIRKAFKIERREGKRKLFPIRLMSFEAISEWECFDAESGKDLGVELREYFIPDFTVWKEHEAFEKAFARLLGDLKAEASGGE